MASDSWLEGHGFITRAGAPRSKVKREAYKLVVATSDVISALEACRALRALPGGLRDPLYAPLSCAMIVCYARPFSDNRPHGPLPARWSRFADTVQRDVHDDLVEARNQIIAHSDANARVVHICGPGTRLGETDLFMGSSEEAIGTAVQTYIFGPDRLGEIEDSIAALGRRLDLAKQKVLLRLYGGFDLPRGRFRLRIDDGL